MIHWLAYSVSWHVLRLVARLLNNPHIERVEAAQQERVNTFVSGVLVGAVVVVVIVAVVLYFNS